MAIGQRELCAGLDPRDGLLRINPWPRETIPRQRPKSFGEADLTGTVKGNDITFSFSADFQGTSLTSTYKGTVENASSMKGTLEISGVGSGTFTAKKK